MGVCGWIYANLKVDGGRGDYHVRLCSPRLEAYRPALIRLSGRLLSVERRYGEAQGQLCWFSGFLDERRTMYLVAVGAGQEQLLGMPLEGGGYRKQFGVLAYGFYGEDIRLYPKDTAMFEPLKRLLRQMQQTGNAYGPEDFYVSSRELSAFAIPEAAGERPRERPEAAGKNIVRSEKERDERLWRESLLHPVMTGILSAEDGKGLLDLFPGGIVTAAADAELFYRPEGKKESLARKLQREQAEEQRRREIRDQRTEEIRRQQRAYEEIVRKNPKKRGGWKLIVCAVLIAAGIGIVLYAGSRRRNNAPKEDPALYTEENMTQEPAEEETAEKETAAEGS